MQLNLTFGKSVTLQISINKQTNEPIIIKLLTVLKMLSFWVKIIIFYCTYKGFHKSQHLFT